MKETMMEIMNQINVQESRVLQRYSASSKSVAAELNPAVETSTEPDKYTEHNWPLQIRQYDTCQIKIL